MEKKQKVLSKKKELESYIQEIESIKPGSLEEYKGSIEKKRACERLLQISIEAIIDMAYLIYKEVSSGVPGEDASVIEGLFDKKVIGKDIKELLLKINSFRNILVHKYGTVNDELVFENLQENLDDFNKVAEELVKSLKNNKNK